MDRPGLPELSAFAAVAGHRSFRRASIELGLSPSTLSHTMRALERRIGVRLLNRTTRSVAPTEAGERLLARLRPALRDLDAALDEVDEFRGRPGGTLRINAGEIAVRVLLGSVVPTFRRRFPDVHLDLVSEGRLVDIVAEGFDAGVRLGEALPQDMIAVPFDGEARCVVVGSPNYLAGRPPPGAPDDLVAHDCIRFRLPSGKLLRWEFGKHGQELSLDVTGPLTLDNSELMIAAAQQGLGLAYVLERSARPHLASGTVRAVLEDWCPGFPGMFLYYPGHRHVPPALRAFIDVLKAVG